MPFEKLSCRPLTAPLVEVVPWPEIGDRVASRRDPFLGVRRPRSYRLEWDQLGTIFW
jgi:hypothetical protein